MWRRGNRLTGGAPAGGRPGGTASRRRDDAACAFHDEADVHDVEAVVAGGEGDGVVAGGDVAEGYRHAQGPAGGGHGDGVPVDRHGQGGRGGGGGVVEHQQGARGGHRRR